MSYKKRGTRNMSETFLPANILMPQVDSMKKWAVIACDQFSSQPEYWDEVKEYVGNTPSTLHLMHILEVRKKMKRSERFNPQ